MKTKHFTILTMLLLFSVLAYGAKITGRIIDSGNSPLPGANIKVLELGTGTISDNEGFFYLTKIEPGDYVLEVTYIGFKTVSKQVTIESDNDVVNVKISLTPGVEMSELVVSGSMPGQAKALNQQKNSVRINNVISSAQIETFPDANIGDALKRIPGINVQYDQGEARFGNIRGLSPEMNSITIDGERIPSAEAETRSIQLDLVPSEMISTIEVNKVVTSDMDADAIGGSVNLLSKTTPVGRKIEAEIGSGYNFISQKPQIKAYLLYSDRFLNNKLGMTLSGSYYDNILGSDNNELEWDEEDGEIYVSDFQIRQYFVERLRQSYSAAFDYQINEDHSIKLSGLYNRRKDWENRYRLQYKDMEFDDGEFVIGEIRREVKAGTENIKYARLEDQTMMDFSLNGDHMFGHLKADWKVSYSKASEDRPNERYMTVRYKDPAFSYDFSNPENVKLNITDPDGKELNKEWGFKELTEEFQYTEDVDFRAKVDFKLPLLTGKYENKLKFGAKYKMKSKLRDNDFYEYEPADEDAFMASALATAESQTRDGFMAGHDLMVGNFISREFLGNLDMSTLDGEQLLEELAGNFKATESVTAAYVLLEQSLGKKVDLVAGVRMEYTQSEYKGNSFEISEEGDESLTPTENEADSYMNVLPSLSMKYSPTKSTNVKLGFSQTLARPKYFDLVPYQIINFEDSEIEIGNPELVPTHATNIDLLGEHFFSSIGIVSAGVFYKSLTDVIVDERKTDFTFNGTEYEKYKKPMNAGDGYLMGAEFAFQRQFDFLPGFLKQFSIYANYTYNVSEFELNLEDREGEKTALPGTPENQYNVSLMYDNKRLSARVSFNHASAFIDEFGDSEFYDRYYDKVSYLDANTSYKITKNLLVYANVNNLLNQPLSYFQGVEERTMQAEYYGMKVKFGLRLTL